MFQRYFDAVEREAVRAARSTGRSWADIADAAGIAKQSAWEKWKDVSKTREDLQRRLDEQVERQKREAVHSIADQTVRLMRSGELQDQARELRKAVLALTLSKRRRQK